MKTRIEMWINEHGVAQLRTHANEVEGFEVVKEDLMLMLARLSSEIRRGVMACPYAPPLPDQVVLFPNWRDGVDKVGT